MTGAWILGLLRRRAGRVLAASFGIALAVSLLASLGSFIAGSEATMTQRASAGVAVDWQVAVQPNVSGGGVGSVMKQLRRSPATRAALPVGYADSPGLTATTGGTSQSTGAARVLGLPASYHRTFPRELHLLTGSFRGALVAAQTASNLHVAPGDTVRVARSGANALRVQITGVVDLPQADSLFQKVGAPPQAQAVAPPDNVVLLPQAVFARAYSGPAGAANQSSTQVHVRRGHALPSSPAAAYSTEIGMANHLSAATSGVGVVGDNLGAVLDAARQDAAYSQVLFLFLGAPGALLAGALTAAVAEAGAPRRRAEQRMLRHRGASTAQLGRLITAEASVIAVVGGVVGLLGALVIGRLAFGANGFGATPFASVVWAALAFLVGGSIAALAIAVPARRELRRPQGAREEGGRPRWLAWGLDLILLAVALGVFYAAGRNQYSLVLAPEGVPTLSVSYWAFLAPGLGWLAAGLLGWRLTDVLLGPGQRLLGRLLRPFAGNLSGTVAAMMGRQRRVVGRSAVLVGLALSFAVSTATFNATYHQQAEADAQLTNGADVTVTESPGTAVPASYGTKLAQVPGVQAVAPMLHRFAYVGADLQNLYGIKAGSISQATTLQDPYFQGGSAQTLLRRLAARPDGVLVSAETVKDYQLSLGNLIRLRLQDQVRHTYRTISFHYVGIVNEFPTAPKDSFLVANAGYVAQQTGSPAVGTFLVSTGGQHLGQVASAIRRTAGPGAAVKTLNSARGSVGSSLTAVDLSGLTRLELSFALVIAAAAGGLVIGLGLNERRRSTAVATAIGASPRQLRQLSLGEPLFVTVSGMLIGAVGGSAIAYLLIKVLTGVFDPPPASAAVPWSYLIAVVLSVVLAIGAAASLVTARASSRANEYLREI